MDWFISDTHFNHKNIIRFADRPFESVEQMNKTMIENWNRRVGESDTVIHLGDFGLPIRKAAEILEQLNGEKILIRGNHDRNSPGELKVAGFSEVYDELDYGPNTYTNWQTFHLTHKPTILKPGPINLVGHIHQQFVYQGNNLNMSVEVWGYQPVTMKEIVDRIDWLQENVYDTNTKMILVSTKNEYGKGGIFPPIPGQ